MDPDPDTTFHFDGSGSLDHKNLQQQKITEKHHEFVKKFRFLCLTNKLVRVSNKVSKFLHFVFIIFLNTGSDLSNKSGSVVFTDT